MTDRVRAALDAIPDGYSDGQFEGRRYRGRAKFRAVVTGLRPAPA